MLTLVMLIGMIPFAAIPAFAETGEEYLDANGVKQTVMDATEITEGGSYGEGWYILSGEKSIGRVTFTGDAHLILADDASVTVNGGIILNGCSLAIYGQSAGTGKLTVKDAQDYCSGIGSGEQGSCGDITINGGTVTLSGTVR